MEESGSMVINLWYLLFAAIAAGAAAIPLWVNRSEREAIKTRLTILEDYKTEQERRHTGFDAKLDNITHEIELIRHEQGQVELRLQGCIHEEIRHVENKVSEKTGTVFEKIDKLRDQIHEVATNKIAPAGNR